MTIIRSRAVLGVLYSLFVAFFPWVYIRGQQFADLENYVTRIEYLKTFGGTPIEEGSILGWLKFEIVWYWLLNLIAEFNLDTILSLKFITIISSYLSFRFVARNIGNVLGILLLLNPITIDLLSSQLRSAFAFSLFLAIVIDGPNLSSKKNLLLFLLPFIHTAMSVVLVMYWFSKILSENERFRNSAKVLLALIFSVLSICFVAFALPIIADLVDDRRNLNEYPLKSFKYVLFWLFFGGALIVLRNRVLRPSWIYYFSLIVCVFSASLELIGSPGFRFLALSLPVVFSSIVFLAPPYINLLLVYSIFYNLLLYVYWAT